ncbi:hypothetical protein [Cohnella sp. WQ 127256]|uniref:hypothetical protein n=1 Tax=Cohnella sp. WQ 127256 TaxID=2938790 RepID=UPI0021176CD5|nr:hypothetical protein [Cohnella sp. WQ 127256]
MKVITTLCVFLLLVMGCQRKEHIPVIKEVSSDFFTLRVKVEKVEKAKIKIHTELVYTGDRSIQIIHMDPLIGAVVGERSNRPDIVRSFVGIQRTLSNNEAYSYEKDRIMDIRSDDKVLYAEAIFSIEGESVEKKKILDLEINLDEL